MTRKIKQRRVDRPALRPPFRVLAVLLGLLSLYVAISEWRSFPVLTLLFAVIFLVSGLGGDVGVQWVDRWQFRLLDALVGGIAWCRRQVARLLGREPQEVAPAWYGRGPLPRLDELGTDAALVLECDDDLMDKPFERKPHHTALDLVIELYAHGRCDWFAVALREAAGWAIVAVASPGQLSVHRLNRDPQGRLVDVYGHVTLDELRRRYGIDDLEIVENGRIPRGNAPRPKDLPWIASAMLHLPHEPFVSMRRPLEEWVRTGDMPARGRVPGGRAVAPSAPRDRDESQ
jgi:hypothetical protein